MRKLIGLALVASLVLNAFLLLDRRRQPPPEIRTRVIEKQIPSLEPSAPASVPVPVAAPAPTPVAEPRPVAPVRVTLVASPAYVEPGGEITVTCTVASGAPQARQWIGMYAPEAAVTSYSQYQMVRATAISYVFKAPKNPGDVEFRYILEDDRTAVATSNPVRVHGAPPARPQIDLQAGSTVVRCGGEATVRWSVYSGQRTGQDWIGFFAPGAKNEHFLGWKYVPDADQGFLTLQAPEEPGTYEFRYLLDNGYEAAAVSVRITVVP
jgi:Ca-activated chloride channel homolog